MQEYNNLWENDVGKNWSALVPGLRERYPKLRPLPIFSCSTVFADDTKLFEPIDLPGAKNDLQADLNSLQKWSLDWGTEFNKSKCQVLHVSRKKFKTSAEYELDGHQLECVSCVKDLGVTVSCDLSWSKHIEFELKTLFQ